MTFALGIILAGLAVFGLVGIASATSAGSAGTTTSGSSSASGPLPTGGQSHGLVTTAALAKLAAQHHWSAADVANWMKLIISESNGTLTDTNPGSGAYGIAQFINGPSEYYTYGGNPNSLVGQLTAMANYIAQRYGNPTNAWNFHLANNYY